MAATDSTPRSLRAAGVEAPDPLRRRARAAWRRVVATGRDEADATVNGRGDESGSLIDQRVVPVSSFPSLVAELRHCSWNAAGDIVLDGWSYLPTAIAQTAGVTVFAALGGIDQVWRAEVSQREDPEVGAFSSRTEDLSGTAWTATLPGAFLSPLLREAGAGAAQPSPGATTWALPVWVEHDFGTFRQRSPFSSRYRWGSAAGLPGRVVDGELWATTSWCEGTGLSVVVQTDCVVVEGVSLQAAALGLRVNVLGSARPAHLQLSDGLDRTFWPAGQHQGVLTVTSRTLPDKGAAVTWTADDGSVHRVLANRPALTLGRSTGPGAAATAATLSAGDDGALVLARRPRLVQLEDVRLIDRPDPTLLVQGWAAGDWTGPLSVELRGSSGTLSATAELVDGGFRVEIPMLHTDPWGNAGLAPAPGGYRLWVAGADGAEIAVLGSELAGRLYEWPVTEWFNARLEHHPDGGLWVMVNDARPLTEIGPAARRRLRARYQSSGPIRPVEDTIYFESFDGLVCACNPKAVHDEVRRRGLDLTLYWGVKDRSVPVPDGARPITINSAEWWRVRHQARYLVANNWVHDTWARGPEQRVLQTWHGTAFKLLALDRPRARHDAGFVDAVRAERSKWDLLLTENAYSVDLMRQAYGYAGAVLESGYPRNDVLTSPSADVLRESLRTRLGITPDQHAVLYAPTWRDDRETMVDHLDLSELAAALGPSYVILARGHSRTLRTTSALDSERVIDVSSYQEISHLFCAADLCITDYSSVMFDFTVTGKPVLFFAPDYERYVHSERGSYFDLRDTAPGPVLTRFDETVEAVVAAEEVRRSWDPRYRDWVATYNAWDDGQASARAVDALLRL